MSFSFINITLISTNLYTEKYRGRYKNRVYICATSTCASRNLFLNVELPEVVWQRTQVFV